MPKAQVSIETNFEDGVKTVKNLRDELPESAEDVSKILAHEFIREGRRQMRRNGSVETGTGIQSFRTENRGQGETLVFGADYLISLDRGTTAHYPDTNNYRFIQWARNNGFSRQQLAETIADQGTRPHPWIEQSTTKIRSSAPNRLKANVRDAVQNSLTRIV